jgi:cytochrome c
MDDNFNTIAGWTLGSAIVLLGLTSISGHYFSANKPHRPHEMGYEIEGVEEEAAEEAVPLATLLAEADASRGETLFAKCMSCHTVNPGGASGIGPNLHGIIGQPVAQAPGFAFSSALKEVGGTWTFEQMDEWLRSPKAFAPGTKMTFAGMSKPEERAAMLAYLNSQGSNLPLPAPPAPSEEPAAGEGGDAEEAAAQAVGPSGPVGAGTPMEAGAMAQPAPAVESGGSKAVGSVSKTQGN